MIIEKVINQTIQFDPKTPHYLEKLHQKYLKINIEGLSRTQTFFVHFTKTKIHFSKTHQGEIDATIQGNRAAFISFALNKDIHKALKAGLSLEGDMETLQIIQEWFRALDIDWEEILSKATGDALANPIANLIKGIAKKQRQFFEDTLQSASEYLKEESKLFPAKIEAEDFMNDIDILRADADRLEARILKLQNVLASDPSA